MPDRNHALVSTCHHSASRPPPEPDPASHPTTPAASPGHPARGRGTRHLRTGTPGRSASTPGLRRAASTTTRRPIRTGSRRFPRPRSRPGRWWGGRGIRSSRHRIRGRPRPSPAPSPPTTSRGTRTTPGGGDGCWPTIWRRRPATRVLLGWDGIGRQRAEFALPGAVQPDGDDRVLVDVRVRVTPYRAVGVTARPTGARARPGPARWYRPRPRRATGREWHACAWYPVWADRCRWCGRRAAGGQRPRRRPCPTTDTGSPAAPSQGRPTNRGGPDGNGRARRGTGPATRVPDLEPEGGVSELASEPMRSRRAAVTSTTVSTERSEAVCSATPGLWWPGSAAGLGLPPWLSACVATTVAG